MNTKSIENIANPSVIQKIQSKYESLRKSEKKVADYIFQYNEIAITSSISEVASNSCVSEATVIRFCKAVGYSGFQDLKINLAKNHRETEPLALFENISKDDELDVAVQKIFSSNILSFTETFNNLDFVVLKKIAKKLKEGRIIFLYGLGTSGMVTEYASYRFARMGITTKEYVNSHSIALSTAGTNDNDIAIFITQSGSTKEIVEAIEELKKKKTFVIVITGYANSPAAKASDIFLKTSIHENPFESGGIRSLLAQLCIIDAVMVAVAMEDFDESIKMIQLTAEAVKSKKY